MSCLPAPPQSPQKKLKRLQRSSFSLDGPSHVASSQDIAKCKLALEQKHYRTAMNSLIHSRSARKTVDLLMERKLRQQLRLAKLPSLSQTFTAEVHIWPGFIHVILVALSTELAGLWLVQALCWSRGPSADPAINSPQLHAKGCACYIWFERKIH